MNKIVRKDIEGRKDVELLVNKFYQQVRKDELIGSIFNEIIGSHWAEHLQKLYDFWESRLFGKDVYNGKPLFVHKPLPIDSQHFDRWLKLWGETLDLYFIGNKVAEAKLRAENISNFFQEKLKEMREQSNG